MDHSRTSRRLDIKQDIKPSADSHSATSLNDAAEPSKEMLRELFADELEVILESERKLFEKKVREELQYKFDQRVSEIQVEILEQKKQISEELEKFSEILASLKNSYETKIKEDVVHLHQIVVEVTMCCLTKILGDGALYKDLVGKQIKDSLEKRSVDVKALIKVSESEFKFLKKNFGEADWIHLIRVDDRLEVGQVVLDDGFSSLYEFGFVNQLDVLRSAFMRVLQEHHAI